MKRFFLSVVLIATAVCAAAQQKDWANFGRYAEANAAIKQSPDVVFMGNSITDNWAHMDPDFFAKNNFVGRGISGQTSSEMLVRFRRDVIDLKPEAVVILSGTNDVAQNNGYISPENKMIEAYAKANKIHFLNYYPALTDEKGGLPPKWSGDACHPNLVCYRTVMEPMVCDAVAKVLKKKRSAMFVAPAPEQ